MALWREGLLAQRVLASATRGYRHHPQLKRFRALPDPTRAIGSYLHAVWEEAARRGYSFEKEKIAAPLDRDLTVLVTDGQLRYERAHLAAKLARRDPAASERLQRIHVPAPHPSFVVVPGPIADWERPSI